MREKVFVFFVFFACLLPVAQASTVFETPDGTTVGGQPVNAQVQYILTLGLLEIDVYNLQDDPTSVIQNVSSLSFTLSGGLTASALSSSTGEGITIASDGTYSTLGPVSTGWVLAAGGLGVCDIPCAGTGAPAYTIIGGPGPGNVYTGNASIRGNGPHNPFLQSGTGQPAKFYLTVPGLTSGGTVLTTVVGFGTDGNDHVTMTGVLDQVPEPGTIGLLGLGLVIGAVAVRRRTRNRA